MASDKHVLTPNERRVILKVEEYFKKEKENGGPLLSTVAVQQRTADSCGISRRTLVNIHNLQKDGDIEKKNKKRRLSLKTKDLPEGVKCQIREVIYDMYKQKEVVTLDSTLEKIRSREICDIGRNSLSSVLKQLGFKYHKTNNRKILCEQQHIVSKRWSFLRKYLANLKSENSKPVVFLDETWIFAKGNQTKYSWQDGSKYCYSRVSSGNGKRYVIVHAGSRAGFLPDASLVFTSSKKVEDYHDNMTAAIFENWFEEYVLKSLEEPSIIILDNASYHSRVSEKIPNNSSNKDEMRNWLNIRKIKNDHIFLKADLLSEIKVHTAGKDKSYVVDSLAGKYGHEVLRLPPYHCEFNAIELVWGICKNYYDKHACQTTNEESILNLWSEALKQTGPETWSKCIDHVEQLIQDTFESEQVIDEIRPIIITSDSDSDNSADSDIDN